MGGGRGGAGSRGPGPPPASRPCKEPAPARRDRRRGWKGASRPAVHSRAPKFPPAPAPGGSGTGRLGLLAAPGAVSGAPACLRPAARGGGGGEQADEGGTGAAPLWPRCLMRRRLGIDVPGLSEEQGDPGPGPPAPPHPPQSGASPGGAGRDPAPSVVRGRRAATLSRPGSLPSSLQEGLQRKIKKKKKSKERKRAKRAGTHLEQSAGLGGGGAERSKPRRTAALPPHRGASVSVSVSVPPPTARPGGDRALPSPLPPLPRGARRSCPVRTAGGWGSQSHRISEHFRRSFGSLIAVG